MDLKTLHASMQPACVAKDKVEAKVKEAKKVKVEEIVDEEPAEALNSDYSEGIPSFGADEEIPDPEAEDDGSDPRVAELIETKLWKFHTLYKTSATGAVMCWWIGFDYETSEIVTVHKTMHTPTPPEVERRLVEVNQSKRTLHEQAVLEIRQRRLKKYRLGYREAGAAAPELGQPMLAEVIEKYKHEFNFPVAVQPKLDGIRCLVREADDGNLMYRSRGNLQYRQLAPHMDPELSVLLSYLPSGIELDGELYVENEKFENIASIFGTKLKEHARIKELIYHIYDFNTTEPLAYEHRWYHLYSAYKQYLADGYTNTKFKILNTVWAESQEEIDECYERYLEHGFEGAMVRHTTIGDQSPAQLKLSLYRVGRSTNLLKVKQISDEEVTVVGVVDCAGREKGCAKFEVEDDEGKKFNVRPGGSLDQRRYWFKHPEEVIGRRYTIVYNEKTIKGIPRNPRGKAFRDYE
jgi:DNA ligase-1